MSDKYGKYLSPEDKEDTVFSSDRSQLHRDTVRDDLETSTQRDVIRQQGYLDTPQQPYYSAGAPGEPPRPGQLSTKPGISSRHRKRRAAAPRASIPLIIDKRKAAAMKKRLIQSGLMVTLTLIKRKKGINSAFEITITEQEQKRQLPRLRVLHQHQCTAQRNGSAI